MIFGFICLFFSGFCFGSAAQLHGKNKALRDKYEYGYCSGKSQGKFEGEFYKGNLQCGFEIGNYEDGIYKFIENIK